MKYGFVTNGDLNNESIIVLYINELPFELPHEYIRKYIEIKKNKIATQLYDKQLCLELYKKKDHSNYALLGCSYTNTCLPLQIEINIYETKENYYTDIKCIDQDKKFKGIKYEYIEYIENEVLEFFKDDNKSFSGKIEFNIGAYCEIGSSGAVFKDVTKKLLNLLLMEEYDFQGIKNTLFA